MNITFTGVDCRTGLDALPVGPEYAVLYSATRADNRYMDYASIVEVLNGLRGHKTALHVCGKPGREALLAGSLAPLVELVGRVQVNGVVSVEYVEAVCSKYPNNIIITQHHEKNVGLLGVTSANHAVLVDGSGGRGVVPNSWVRPDTLKAVGFAGGLRVSNFEEHFSRLMHLGQWVDMESGVRTEDNWFDVVAVQKIWYSFRSLLGEL